MKRNKADKNAQRCPICQVWVPSTLFGKHLVSQLHISRSLNHPRHHQCIMDHIELIVREAPFQCRLCRFFCHCHDDLLTHWQSLSHKNRDNTIQQGTYFCGLCRTSCANSDVMYNHLRSQDHLNCVDIVNKSVPLLVNKLEPVQCHLCGKSFRYHVQLNKHLPVEHSVANDYSPNNGEVLFNQDINNKSTTEQ